MERKRFIYLRFSVRYPSNPGQETRSEKKTTEKSATWLASHGFLGLLSYATLYHLSEDDTSHSELGPPTLIVNQENAPTIMPTSHSDGGNFSNEISSLLTRHSICVKLKNPTSTIDSFSISHVNASLLNHNFLFLFTPKISC